jgi:hypothetical protein
MLFRSSLRYQTTETITVTVPVVQRDRLFAIMSSTLTVHLMSHELTAFIQKVTVPLQFTLYVKISHSDHRELP